jgi:release factor glutamine methyltransferase
MTLLQTIDAATRRLADAGVPSPRHDAEALAAHVLRIDRGELWQAEVGPGFQRAFDDLVERRERREPLQHMTGVAYFRHGVLAVGPGVFVPRPETELVAGAAIDEARRLSAGRPPHRPVVVDLGTGSGAIARSVADEVPTADVHAVELAEDALVWAKRNLEGSRVQLWAVDLAAALPELNGTVDVVVSNPPYVPLDGVPRDPEVRDYDPGIALYAGDDGLEIIRVLERVAARMLRPGGLVVVEHADEQGVSAPALFLQSEQWADVEDHDDLAGRPRFVTARRAEGITLQS